MGTTVVSLALLTAGALALLAVMGALLIVRRYLLARGLGTFDCSMRRESPSHSTGPWMLGLARYEHDRLDWFRVLGVSFRPSRSLSRSRLVIVDQRPQAGRQESISLAPGWVIIQCSYGVSTVELGMSDAAYNGLAAWVESGPPGRQNHIS